MTFDGNRVRIELTDALRFHAGDDALTVIQQARIWLPDELGTISGARKPEVKIDGESRPELLRNLAAWIEQHSDPGLSKLAADFAAQREAL